ncbi:8803_t:CDS:2 [Ambispora gerdemannii]|uniref:8803_t:CDS:1 n=1 Tax=Ambispora gerdemannii TaxID=144530 RepID=A0A9N9CA12_9GLOM|nr:8803_t:CDS:2 [Ambispora gerdemannii]
MVYEHDVWDSISDSMNKEQKLQKLINHLPANNYLTAHEYISIDNSKVEHGLTDEEILAAIADEDKEEEESVDEQVEKVSCNEAEKSINQVLQFLYEQGPEFGEINEENRNPK